MTGSAPPAINPSATALPSVATVSRILREGAIPDHRLSAPATGTSRHGTQSALIP